MDIDNIENWDPPEVLKKYWAGGISGEAKDGSVVWIDMPCHLDYKGGCKFMADVSHQDWLLD